MTPERQKWWDSLPTEEKRVRRSIAKQRATIQFAKAVMNDGFLFDTEEYMDDIREAKHAIKALRKQIAMQTLASFESLCPCCHRMVLFTEDIYWGDLPNCCEQCGQKLRWK